MPPTNASAIKKLESQIAKLPKGSITRKVIQGKDRYYLQWREGDKVRSRYLKEAELPEISARIAERRDLQQQLLELQVSSIQGSMAVATMAADNVAPYFPGNLGKGGDDAPRSNEDGTQSVCLANFLLALNKGFCLESQQRRLHIDDHSYLLELVFYNRLLHCGVLVTLKDDVFSQAHLQSLDACVTYYRENEMQPGDSLPVGMLLCTRKGAESAEYAVASMDENLFALTYAPVLPTKAELTNFLKRTK